MVVRWGNNVNLDPMSLFRGAAALLALLTSGTTAYGQSRTPKVDYNRSVLPILANNCFLCHGSDTARRQAGLRLDVGDGAYKKLPSGGVAIIPGDPGASALVKRITARDALQMPPALTHKTLSAGQIATLKRWVAEGGKYAPHWSYVVPTRPAVPIIKQTGWCRNPIDNFLLARLQREGLTPSPVANRATLVRRLSLDLTGLPPSPAEVTAFVTDSKPGAYERLVDRLLASPHYGERMATYWLDLVRYADTVGYHGDQDVSVWPYRDYVIRAFNTNKRFDVFTREQLAGDLLPNATQETRVASGYNRLGMMTAEGGAQDKEYLAKYAAERIRNASTVWLGSTLGCAECHDHKYDPFSQKDFYSFGAFFADLKEHGFYGGGGGGDWGPSLRLITPAQKTRLDGLDAEIATAQHALDSVSNESLADGRARWVAQVRALDTDKRLAWSPTYPTAASSTGGSALTIGGDGSVLATGKFPTFDTYTVTLPAGPNPISSVRLNVLGDGSLPGDGISRAGSYFVLSEFELAVQHGDTITPVRISSVVVNAESDGFPGAALIDGRPDTGWAHLYGGARTALFRLAQPLPADPSAKLIVRLRSATKAHLTLGKFSIMLSALEHADFGSSGVSDPVLAAIRKPGEQRTAAETQSIAVEYRSAAPELEEGRRRLATLERERSLLYGQLPLTLVAEATTPRTMRVLARGNWMDDSGAVVLPAVPHFLPQILPRTPVNDRASRLDLANWLVSPDNPLTARVTVNRLWKQFFGIGLSKSLDDFGVQGEDPMHPELLDWLATEFVASGWDVRHIVRLMVTCNAYLQDSRLTPQLEARDPFNRLYARQSTFRIDAEFVRDTMLDAAGLLSPSVGGPSVYPYEPKGFLASLNFPRREWAASAGEDLYRRGLYTQWQRSFLHPSLVAFDAPTREEATCTRTVSNTPMQALVLLNDPTFVEAARVFAARIVHEGGATFAQRLTFAYRTVLSRAPTAQEVEILRDLYHRQQLRYRDDRAAADALIAIGESPIAQDLEPRELAAWTSVARAILNLDETITRS